VRLVNRQVEFESKGELDAINLTEKILPEVESSGIINGTVTVFTPTSTASLTTLENEPGLLEDFTALLRELVPKTRSYKHKHDNPEHEVNAQSHLRAALLGQALVFPLSEGKLIRGGRQHIIFVELDNRTRKRQVLIQVIGE